MKTEHAIDWSLSTADIERHHAKVCDERDRLRAELDVTRNLLIGVSEQYQEEMSRRANLETELDALKRNNTYCPMCGSGTVPSVPDDTALLRQALDVLVNHAWALPENHQKYALAINALRDRLKCST